MCTLAFSIANLLTSNMARSIDQVEAILAPAVGKLELGEGPANLTPNDYAMALPERLAQLCINENSIDADLCVNQNMIHDSRRPCHYSASSSLDESAHERELTPLPSGPLTILEWLDIAGDVSYSDQQTTEAMFLVENQNAFAGVLRTEFFDIWQHYVKACEAREEKQRQASSSS